MKKGKLIVFSGVSGVGKNSILKKLLNNDSLNLTYSISMTTRPKRNNEVDGRDYFFVSKSDFEQSIKNNELLEYETFCDNFYGTPKKFVEEQLNLGKNVILEIEVKGAKRILSAVPGALSIFILPPNINELRNRLINRGTDDMETINKRLEVANEELKQKDLYKYHVVNQDLDLAVKEIVEIIKSEE